MEQREIARKRLDFNAILVVTLTVNGLNTAV